VLCVSAPEGIQFTDVAKTAGIRFTHYKGSHGVSTILEEAGPGVCVADFDSDGYQDIYFVNGRDLYGNGIEVRNALYRNNGNGTFTDVTERAGVPGNAYGLGCIWGDYDNDGHPDLYVTQYGKNILYRNNGDGSFTDVTQKAHVDGTDFGTVFHTGATFFDYDATGFLISMPVGTWNSGRAAKGRAKSGLTFRRAAPPLYTRAVRRCSITTTGTARLRTLRKLPRSFSRTGRISR
jgi:hypothetical protein